MDKAPSNDPSLVLHRPSARVARTQGDGTKRPTAVDSGFEPSRWARCVRSAQSQALRSNRLARIARANTGPRVVELLRRVALVITVGIVGLWFATLSNWSTCLLGAVIVEVAPDGASAEQAFERSHSLQDKAPYTAVDFKAVEFAPDDDGPFCEWSLVSPFALRCGPPVGRRAHALRFACSKDTSRFAAGACLPRGPPA